MKKTLLSIITMATLASSTVYAQPVNKDISVTAEINGLITMKKANGDDLREIALDYDNIKNDGTYVYSQNIKIVSNTGSKVKINLRSPLVIESDGSGFGGLAKEFEDTVVKLGNTELKLTAKSFTLVNNEVDRSLSISAKKPATALSGEVYTGTLELVIEDEA